MARFRKADIEFHRDGYGPVHAAVNVKIYPWTEPDLRAVARDEGADAETASGPSRPPGRAR